MTAPAEPLSFGAYSIRKHRPADLAALVREANHPEVSLGLRDRFPYPYTEEDGRRYLAAAAADERNYHAAICEDDVLIGGIGLVLGDDVHRGTAELGYWLGPSHWGRGVATQAVGLVVREGFTRLGLRRIWAGVYESNPASMRVLVKNGFRREGVLRRAVTKRGRILDQHLFALLREEWEG